MRSAVGPFLAAVVLAVVGGAFWIAGHTETRLAEVHRQLATLRYADASAGGGDVEQSLGVERRVPMIGKAVETDARDARAAAGYWRTDYASIAPQHDANGVVTETDPAILFLSANAAYRASQSSIDRADAVRRLDNVVRSYAEVLKTQGNGCTAGVQSCLDAAFNYEYTIRTRDGLAKGRGNAAARIAKVQPHSEDDDLPAGPTLHGHPGGPPPATDMNQFKIVIPKRGEERKDAPDAGKGGQKIRKG